MSGEETKSINILQSTIVPDLLCGSCLGQTNRSCEKTFCGVVIETTWFEIPVCSKCLSWRKNGREKNISTC